MPDEEAIRAYQREQYDSGELRASVRDLAASLGRPQLTGAEKYVKGLAESVLKQCEKIERLEQERDRLRADLAELRQRGEALAAAAEYVIAYFQSAYKQEVCEKLEAVKLSRAALRAWRGEGE